ncbi:hypothetical protein LTR15_009690 [Elasticomyces elasticus]|nr:hypothetical protein LTR15_009690 [Elasticomyces elasticus]
MKVHNAVRTAVEPALTLLLRVCVAALILTACDPVSAGNVDSAHKGAWRSRAGGLSVFIANDLPHQRYLANITLGSPPQRFSLTIDSGSTDVWAPAVDSTGCAPSCPAGFSFGPASSSSIVDLHEVFNATYGLTPDLQVVGEYYNDIVGIEGAEIHNMTGNIADSLQYVDSPRTPVGFHSLHDVDGFLQIAVGNIPPTLYEAGYVGFIGLGSRYAEAIFRNPQRGPPSPNDTYPTIYDQLYLQGYTVRRLFSLWLGPQAAPTGELLFGGIDRSKFKGSPLRRTPVLLSDGLFTDWAVNLTSIVDSNNETELISESDGIEVILDSGAPNMYLPVAVANAVAARFNATIHSGFPYVDCAVRNLWSESLSFSFSAVEGHLSPHITVPIPEVVYPFGDPANIGDVRATDGTPLCYLGVQGTPGPIYLLGHTFQRSAYLVFDPDELTISLAQANGC